MSRRPARVCTETDAHRDGTCHVVTKGKTIRPDATTKAMTATIDPSPSCLGTFLSQRTRNSILWQSFTWATGHRSNVQTCLSCDAPFRTHSLVPPCGGRFLGDAPGETRADLIPGTQTDSKHEVGLHPDRGKPLKSVLTSNLTVLRPRVREAAAPLISEILTSVRSLRGTYVLAAPSFSRL